MPPKGFGKKTNQDNDDAGLPHLTYDGKTKVCAGGRGRNYWSKDELIGISTVSHIPVKRSGNKQSICDTLIAHLS